MNGISLTSGEIYVLQAPMRTKEIDRLAEDVVVDEAGVDGEEAHQRDQIPPVEEVVPNLVVRLAGNQLFLLDDAPQGKEEGDGAVAGVPKHDGKQEGEGDDGEDGGVHLAVGGHAVGVDQRLEGGGELVGAEKSWRGLRGLRRKLISWSQKSNSS